MVAQFAFLIDKASVEPVVQVDGHLVDGLVQPRMFSETPATPEVAETTAADLGGDTIERPLIDLAVARSGDKGNNANIGVIARAPELLPYIKASITPASVAGWFQHYLEGEVTRFDVPGMNALNFLLTNCLGGGGTSSLHLDSQAKTYGQQILAMPVRLPADLAAGLERRAG